MLGFNKTSGEGSTNTKVLVFRKDHAEMTRTELKRLKEQIELRIQEVENIHGMLDVIITEDRSYGCLKALVNTQKARNMVDQITDELGLENRAATDELPDATRLLFTFFRDDGDDNFLEMTETAIQRGALGLTEYKCEPILPLKTNDKTYVATYAVSYNLATELLLRYPVKRLPIGAGKSIRFYMPDFNITARVQQTAEERSPQKKRPKWSRKSLSRSLEDDINDVNISGNMN